MRQGPAYHPIVLLILLANERLEPRVGAERCPYRIESERTGISRIATERSTRPRLFGMFPGSPGLFRAGLVNHQRMPLRFR